MVEGIHQPFKDNFLSKGLSLSGNRLLMIPEVNFEVMIGVRQASDLKPFIRFLSSIQ